MENNPSWIIISSDSENFNNSPITISTPDTRKYMDDIHGSRSPLLPSLNEFGMDILRENFAIIKSDDSHLSQENPFVLRKETGKVNPKNKDESISEMVVYVDPSWDLYSSICSAFKERGIAFNDAKASKNSVIIEYLSLYRKSGHENNSITREPFLFGFITPEDLIHHMKSGPEEFTKTIDSCCSISPIFMNFTPILPKWSILCYNFTLKHHQKLSQISKFTFHDAITHLQLYSKTNPWVSVVKNQDVMVSWLVEFIRTASFLPYRRINDMGDSMILNTRTKGVDAKDTFFKMLCEIPQVSEAIAKAVCQRYPTLGHLIKAYQIDQPSRENLLADICVTRPKTVKRIGESISSKIYQVIMGMSNGIISRIK